MYIFINLKIWRLIFFLCLVAQWFLAWSSWRTAVPALSLHALRVGPLHEGKPRQHLSAWKALQTQELKLMQKYEWQRQLHLDTSLHEERFRIFNKMVGMLAQLRHAQLKAEKCTPHDSLHIRLSSRAQVRQLGF